MIAKGLLNSRICAILMTRFDRRFLRSQSSCGGRLTESGYCGGQNWELFREGLDTLWDWVESSAADPDISDTGTQAFDRLQMGQKLALLASVGMALSDEAVPRPDLTVNTESAVAAVFRQIASEVEQEIERSRDPEWSANPDAPEEATQWRRLVLAAYREAILQDEAEALAGSKGEGGRQQEASLLCRSMPRCRG